MITVGCLQFAPSFGNLEKTIDTLSGLIPRAQKANLLVLPELCNSGYNFIDAKQAWDSSETVLESTFINFLTEMCRSYNMHIVSGFNERSGNKLFNSAVWISPEGKLGLYQKLHLFNTEKDFFQPGTTGLPIFDLDDYKIGIQICFDWMFPEAWRVLAIKGADIICHPSNLVLPGLAQRAVPVHAMINRVFTITANRIGSEGNLTFTGLSTIANPEGNILAQATKSEEGIVLVEIDPKKSRNKWITDKNHVLGDRKPENYSLLAKPK